MSVDLYMQHSFGGKDGKLILSMSKEEWRRAMLHTSLKTGALKRLLFGLVGSIKNPKDGALPPENLKDIAKLLEWESENMERYRCNTAENPQIQPNLYLRDVACVLAMNLEYCVGDGRGVLMHVSPEVTKPESSAPGIHTKSSPVSLDYGLGAVYSASITHFDEETRVYCGTIDWSDLVDQFNPKDNWVAHPPPKGVECATLEGLIIRPELINPLVGSYGFAHQDSFSREMQKYISETIMEFKPGQADKE